jgi:uncharacterized protein (DUF952 family)
MAAATIYKLLTRSEWEAAQEEGCFSGSAHDKRDGFIHFSAAAQLGDTARKHFAGVSDLVLLAVDVADLRKGTTSHPVPLGEGERLCPLRFEPSRGGDLFPHLYAPLPISAVKSVTPVPLGPDGTPIIPCGLEP